LRESDFDEKFLLLTSLMTKKSSFFGTLKKGLKMTVFGGLRKRGQKSSFFGTLKKGLKMTVFGGLRKRGQKSSFFGVFRLLLSFIDFTVISGD
jgi:hypothetical protein